MVIIREISSPEDCAAVVDLTQQCFPEEARATGMAPNKWRDLKTDELLRNKLLWEQCGVAVENNKVIGAVVLTVENEPDAALSYWEVRRRAGCIPTLLTYCYDQVLEEELEEHECLIDFLAVSPEARGKGVGVALMQWAEQRARKILYQRVPEAVAKDGVLMTLWVAANNTNATRLYTKQGYTVVHKTNEALYACLSSHVFRRFLGHPVWWKMQRSLSSEAKLEGKSIENKVSVELLAVPAGELGMQRQ